MSAANFHTLTQDADSGRRSKKSINLVIDTSKPDVNVTMDAIENADFKAPTEKFPQKDPSISRCQSVAAMTSNSFFKKRKSNKNFLNKMRYQNSRKHERAAKGNIYRL